MDKSRDDAGNLLEMKMTRVENEWAVRCELPFGDTDLVSLENHSRRQKEKKKKQNWGLGVRSGQNAGLGGTGKEMIFEITGSGEIFGGNSSQRKEVGLA